jgi:hypothetical protein
MDWLATLDPEAPAYNAWRSCPRGEWLLWVAGRVPGVDRRDLVRACCDCAETALHYVPEGEDRPRIAIDAARAWCDRGVPIEEVRAAAYAAYAAAAAAYAAYAAAYAARAAVAAAEAYFAAAARAYLAAALDRQEAQRRNARLVRRRIAWRTVRDGLQKVLARFPEGTA